MEAGGAETFFSTQPYEKEKKANTDSISNGQRGCHGDRREGDEELKKDILAALTFVLTGLLFYVVQSDSRMERFISSEVECDAAGAVLVSEKAPESLSEFTLTDEGTRDS